MDYRLSAEYSESKYRFWSRQADHLYQDIACYDDPYSDIEINPDAYRTLRQKYMRTSRVAHSWLRAWNRAKVRNANR